jgi:hypothetical protein
MNFITGHASPLCSPVSTNPLSLRKAQRFSIQNKFKVPVNRTPLEAGPEQGDGTPLKSKRPTQLEPSSESPL